MTIRFSSSGKALLFACLAACSTVGIKALSTPSINKPAVEAADPDVQAVAAAMQGTDGEHGPDMPLIRRALEQRQRPGQVPLAAASVHQHLGERLRDG